MIWHQRIRDLREDADKTQTDLACYLGTTAQYYGKYEKGERELPFTRAIQLANYYGVSLDYLAGRTKIQSVQSLPEDVQRLLLNWEVLSERNRGKVEFLIDELLKEQSKRKEI